MLLEVELSHRESGIRGTPKRELQDAVLRILTDYSEEIMDAVVAARQESYR